LELIIEGELTKKTLVEPLWVEADELVAIMTSSRKSAAKFLLSETPRKRSRPGPDVAIKNQKSKV
jgi:hypothetical protein